MRIPSLLLIIGALPCDAMRRALVVVDMTVEQDGRLWQNAFRCLCVWLRWPTSATRRIRWSRPSETWLRVELLSPGLQNFLHNVYHVACLVLKRLRWSRDRSCCSPGRQNWFPPVVWERSQGCKLMKAIESYLVQWPFQNRSLASGGPPSSLAEMYPHVGRAGTPGAELIPELRDLGLDACLWSMLWEVEFW